MSRLNVFVRLGPKRTAMDAMRVSIAALTVACVVSACNKSEPTRATRHDEPLKVHDPKGEDESHAFFTANRDRFVPAKLEVPAEVELIVEVYFAPDTKCTGVIVDPGTPEAIEKSLGEGAGNPMHASRSVDIHVRLALGVHALRCTLTTFEATIDAR